MRKIREYKFWLRTASVLQFVTAFIHSLSLIFRPPPANDTESGLFELMESYRFDFGLGFHRSMGDLMMTSLSI
ncbi:MAG: hypothetical protein WBD22_04170 [Pyrinomonadaceae bacterium]